MSSRIPAWLGIAVLGAAAIACAGSAASSASATPSNRSVGAAAAPKTGLVSVPMFGDVTIEDGAFQIMDRGHTNLRVHLVTISRDFHGVASSWADRPGPRGDLRTDVFEIDDQERAEVRSWSEELWQLAPGGRRSFKKPPPDRTPSYAWAAVLRRGDEVRVIDGGGSWDRDPQPEMIEGLVDFLAMHF